MNGAYTINGGIYEKGKPISDPAFGVK